MMRQAVNPYDGFTSSQEPRNIDPTFNAAFIRIFGEDDSRELTSSLVNSMLRRANLNTIGEIDEIHAEHTSITGSVEVKTPRMDVRVIARNRIVDLEAQRYKVDADPRLLFYGAKLMVESTPAGTPYGDIPNVAIISLVSDEIKFPDNDDFVSVCRLKWETPSGRTLCNGAEQLTFVFVELQKIRERYTNLTADVLADEAVAWAYLLTNGYDRKQEVERIMSTFPDIATFAKQYGLAVDDPEVVRAYERAGSAEQEYQLRQKHWKEVQKEAMYRGLTQGLEQGLAKGAADERARIIAIMRERGVDEAVIAACIE